MLVHPPSTHLSSLVCLLNLVTLLDRIYRRCLRPTTIDGSSATSIIRFKLPIDVTWANNAGSMFMARAKISVAVILLAVTRNETNYSTSTSPTTREVKFVSIEDDIRPHYGCVVSMTEKTAGIRSSIHVVLSHWQRNNGLNYMPVSIQGQSPRYRVSRMKRQGFDRFSLFHFFSIVC